MEFLKKISLVLFALLLSGNLSSQTTDDILDAFKKSIEQEENGEYNAAISTLKKVYTSSSYEMNLRLGWLCYQAGQFTESIAYYSTAINLKPYGIEARFGITYPASAQGKWEEVITHYKSILDIAPNNTKALYNLGSIYYGRKEYKTAEKYFEKVINLYPFDYDSLLMMAWTKYQMQDYAKAKVLFKKVLMYSPEDESAQEGLQLIK